MNTIICQNSDGWTGVIHGWDYRRRITQNRIKQIKVDPPTINSNQPFYYVLGHDNSERYAAQGVFTASLQDKLLQRSQKLLLTVYEFFLIQ